MFVLFISIMVRVIEICLWVIYVRLLNVMSCGSKIVISIIVVIEDGERSFNVSLIYYCRDKSMLKTVKLRIERNNFGIVLST